MTLHTHTDIQSRAALHAASSASVVALFSSALPAAFWFLWRR